MTAIRDVDRAEIEPFMAAAKREGLVFNHHTEFYGYFVDGTLAGFAGMMYYRSKVVLQSDYVLPQYRKRGIYTELIRYRLVIARKRGYRCVEINCLPASEGANLRLGAKVTKVYKICKTLVYAL